MATEVKICGLSTPETMEAALAAGADYVGLVFHRASPRHVEIGAARRLAGSGTIAAAMSHEASLTMATIRPWAGGVNEQCCHWS